MMKTIGPKLGVCFGVILLVLLVDSSICCGQTTQVEDVVYLKDGSVIRGTIIEQVPGKSLKIETRDGNVFVYSLDKVERFTKEPIRNSAPNIRQVGRKSGGLAFVLSLLIPGGGQFYNGEGGKGAAMLGASVLGFALMLSATEESNGYYYTEQESSGSADLGAILWLGSAIWSMIDAPISAGRINRKNGLASIYHVSDNIYVDAGVSNIRTRSTTYIRAVLSF